MTAQTAIRLATTGKAEVKQDFAETQKAGTDAMTAIGEAAEASAERAATAAERSAQKQIDSWKRQAAAVKVAAVSGGNQAAFNGALSTPTSQQAATVNLDRSTGAARESAAAFQEMFAKEDAAAAAAAKLRAAIDPLYLAQARYDAELKVWALAASSGEISEKDHAEAVRLSGKALADAKSELEGHSGALSLNRMQMVIGASAAHRFVDSILAGQSPMRAFMMQAGDVATVLQMDDGGVAGGLAKVRALLTPLNLALAGTTAALAIGTAAWLSYSDAIDKAAALSQGAGRVIGATPEGLEAGARAAATAANISVASARDLEAGYVQLGGIGKDVLSGLTALTVDFAAATGQDAKAAQQQLGAAFQDPIKGAQDLTERYGLLTQAQIEQIQKLVEQNDLYGAQATLLADLRGPLAGAADHVNILARAWRYVETSASDAWTAMGRAIDRAVSGGTAVERLADLQSSRTALLARSGDTSQIDREIAAARAELTRTQQQSNAAAGNAARQRAAGVTQQYQGDDREQIARKVGALRAGIAAGGTPDQLKDWSEALAANQHALETWMPAQTKAAKIAEADARIAAAKTPAAKAAAAADKERLEQSGKVATAADVEAQAHAKGAAALATASRAGAGHAATMARDAAAMDASARAALVVAAAYLESGVAGAQAEARRKALTDATKKGIDVEAQVRRELAISVGEAAAAGAKSVSQLKTETAARSAANYAVQSGALDVGQMGQALSDEAALRDLSVKKALAYKLGLTDAYDAITTAIEAYRAALGEAHAEESHSQALQSLDALKKRAEDARLAILYAGDASGGGDRARALLASNREADAQGRNAGDRATNNAAAIIATNTELEARRATSAAEALRTQRDSLALAQLEIGLVGKSAEEHDRIVAAFQLQRSLAHDLGDSYATYAPAIIAAADAAEQENHRLRLVQDTMTEVEDAGSRFIDDLTNPDGSGVKGLLKDIEQELIKLAAINPLKNLLLGQNNPTLGSLFGGGGGGILGKLLGGGSGFTGASLDLGALTASNSAASAGILAGSLPHFAAGSEYTSGGMAWVGEHGPEIVRLPQGSKVSNASDTRRMLAPANDRGASFHFDLRGAVVTQQLLEQMNAIGDGAAIRGASGGAQMAGDRAVKSQRRRLGRAA